METTQETAREPEPLTFERVWKLFQETREQFREMVREAREEDRTLREQIQETDRKLKEQLQETDRKLKEQLQEMAREAREEARKLSEQIAATDKQLQETDRQLQETAKQMKETDKRVGEMTNRFGDMVEHLVVPNLLDGFKAMDFTFEVATKNYKVSDEKNRIFMEVDVFLENGDKVMIVETKATPTGEDVEDHVVRMEKLRKRANSRGDQRAYLGAIAGVVVSESVKNRALGRGFFVVVPSGETFRIIKPEGKYRVREW